MTDKPFNNWSDALKARLARNQAARVERQANGEVTLCIKQRRPPFLVFPLSWAVRFLPERRVTLDAVGTTLWDLCNDVSTMESLVDRFSKQYALTFHEARLLVTQYTNSLIQRGALAVIIRTEPKP